MRLEVPGGIRQTQFAHIQPGEIGRFHVRHAHARQRRHGIFELLPVTAQHLQQFPVPVGAVTVGGSAGSQPEHVDVRHDAIHGCGEAPPQGGIRDDRKGTAQTGEVVGLGRRHQGNATPGCRWRQAGERQMAPPAIENQAAVNFIGAHNEVVAFGKISQTQQFIAIPGPADRVVGMAQQK